MSNKNKKTLISLGISCQTAHQLRRLANPHEDTNTSSSKVAAPSGLFDWLICPIDSTIKLLNNQIPDFTKSSIHIHNGRPFWTDFNIYFWHNFLVGGPDERYIDIKATFEEELRRWRYQRDRFAALDPKKTVFVISNTQNNLVTEVFDESEREQYFFTSDALDALSLSLASYFRTDTDDIHLEVVTRKDRSSDLIKSSTVSFFPRDQNQWKGSKPSWNKWWQNVNACESA